MTAPWTEGVAHRTIARDAGGGRVVTVLTFRPDQPFEVAALFATTPADHVRWVFARDLLAEGLIQPCGDGDVQVSPVLDDEVRVDLCSPDGDVGLYLPRVHVAGFVDAIFAMVPAGRERLDFDAELAELLATSWLDGEQ